MSAEDPPTGKAPRRGEGWAPFKERQRRQAVEGQAQLVITSAARYRESIASAEELTQLTRLAVIHSHTYLETSDGGVVAELGDALKGDALHDSIEELRGAPEVSAEIHLVKAALARAEAATGAARARAVGALHAAVGALREKTRELLPVRNAAIEKRRAAIAERAARAEAIERRGMALAEAAEAARTGATGALEAGFEHLERERQRLSEAASAIRRACE